MEERIDSEKDTFGKVLLSNMNQVENQAEHLAASPA
jgi:hypothetical protein